MNDHPGDLGLERGRVVICTVRTAERPRVPRGRRAHAKPVGAGIERRVPVCGFMETPNLTRDRAERNLDPCELSFFLGREPVVPAGRYMPRWHCLLAPERREPGALLRPTPPSARSRSGSAPGSDG